MRIVYKTIRAIIFVLLIAFLAIRISNVFSLKYEFNEGIIKAFQDYKKKDLNLVAFGSSQVRNGFDSQSLLDKYGISAFTIGTASQPFCGSVYYLKELIKYQKPTVAILDVSVICKNIRKYAAHIIADSADWNLNKLRFIDDYYSFLVNKDGKKKAFNDIIEVMVPFVQYHSRWKELNENDFDGKDVANFRGFIPFFSTSKMKREDIIIDDQKIDPNITYNEAQMKGLLEFIEICKENDIHLILIKTPKNRWSRSESSIIADIADAYHVPFYDFNYSDLFDACHFSPQDDFIYDNEHLNYYGAQKLTDYLAREVLSNYEFSDYERTEEDDLTTQKYKMCLQNEALTRVDSLNDLSEMLRFEGFEVLIQLNNPVHDAMNEKSIMDILRALDLDIDFQENEGNFVCVLQGGKVIYKNQSDEKIAYDGAFKDGVKYRLYSNAERTKTPIFKVDGNRWESPGFGLNILFYDPLNHDVSSVMNVQMSPEEGDQVIIQK